MLPIQKTTNRKFAALLVALLVFLAAMNVAAQTSAFTYQGRLTDNSLSPTAVYDFQFKVFTTATGGTQKGVTVTKTGVQVTNGAFTVVIDPTAAPLFPFNQGEDRYLEISVKPNGGAAGYTTLAPRQRITSAPYALQSLASQYAQTAANANSADNLNGIPADDYALVTDLRFTDERNPTAGSANYIQNNGTTTAQTGNFYISGNGRVGGSLTANSATVSGNASVIGNFQSFGTITGNAFSGSGANLTNLSAANVSGQLTSSNIPFLDAFKIQTGVFDIARIPNLDAGRIPNLDASKITSGTFSDLRLSPNIPRLNAANIFAGTQSADIFNADTNFSLGGESFIRLLANNSSSIGFNTGSGNFSARQNLFVGSAAGSANLSGSYNSFFGNAAGSGNTSGENNTFVGISSGTQNTTGSNNTLVGANASVNTNNLNYATAIGAGATVRGSNIIELGRPGTFSNQGPDGVLVNGELTVWGSVVTAKQITFVPVGGGDTQLCTAAGSNGLRIAANCSSSIRYKKDVETFTPGLDLVKRLRPVAFTWKSSNQRDLGFVAEEVNAVEPLMTTYNDKGEVEGVKYDRISAALVNAVNEQQDEIKQQKEIIERQQKQIDALMKLVCATNAAADVCRPEDK